ncbi:unnamed protein product, partial [Ectocarpus sp. 12 AP-2014]
PALLAVTTVVAALSARLFFVTREGDRHPARANRFPIARDKARRPLTVAPSLPSARDVFLLRGIVLFVLFPRDFHPLEVLVIAVAGGVPPGSTAVVLCGRLQRPRHALAPHLRKHRLPLAAAGG